MTPSVLVLNCAYLALLGSSAVRSLQRLRLLLVAGALCFITFGILEEIWSMVAWNVTIGSMHSWRLLRELRHQRSITLTSAELLVRDSYFAELSDADFSLLWGMGAGVTICDALVIEAGTNPTTVSFVVQGLAAVERGGEAVRHIGRGGLLGEMSFLLGTVADVDVRAQGELVLRQWDERQLRALEQTRPSVARSFRMLMNRDLATKARIFGRA